MKFANEFITIGMVQALIQRAIAQQATGIESIVYDRTEGNTHIFIITFTDQTTSELAVPIVDFFETLYVIKTGSTNPSDDGNFRMSIINDKLTFQRRDGAVWTTISEMGTLSSKYFLIEGREGKIDLLDNGNRYSMLKPSTINNGVVIGNKNGVISLITNGSLVSFKKDSDDYDLNIQALETDVQTGTEFEYAYTTEENVNLNSITFKLANVPAQTTCRLSILDINDKILDENVSPNDFRLGNGDIVANDLNTLNPLTITGLPIGKNIDLKLKFEFSNTVDIKGDADADLNDGRGSRFFPLTTFNINDLRESNVLTEYLYKTMDFIDYYINHLTVTTLEEFVNINRKILQFDSFSNKNLTLGNATIDMAFKVAPIGNGHVNLYATNGTTISGENNLRDGKLYYIYKRKDQTVWYSKQIDYIDD